MERFTISLSESLAKEFDDLIRKKGYQNRSETVRDMLRDLLKSDRLERQEAPYCVAALSYVYNHHARDLAERLTNLQHQHHDLVLSTMHVHLDHDNCLEVLLIKGPAAKVQRLANSIISTKGVKHGRLTISSIGKDLK
jgi:CopG family nickel-responsive transcriptional regulator